MENLVANEEEHQSKCEETEDDWSSRQKCAVERLDQVRTATSSIVQQSVEVGQQQRSCLQQNAISTNERIQKVCFSGIVTLISAQISSILSSGV